MNFVIMKKRVEKGIELRKRRGSLDVKSRLELRFNISKIFFSFLGNVFYLEHSNRTLIHEGGLGINDNLTFRK